MSFQDLEAGRPLASSRINGGRQDPTQAVASGIFQINTAVSTFQRLVNTLGTPKDTPELREKLHKTRLHIGQLVKNTSAKLKEASEADDQAGVNPNKKIAKDFQAVLKEFQKAQRLSAEREIAYTPFVPQAVLPSSYTASEIDVSSDKTPEQRSLLVESRRQEVLLLDNEIAFNEEREQVNEIFKDLAVLVHDQGAMIDDIGTHIDNSQAATSQGKRQQHTRWYASWLRPVQIRPISPLSLSLSLLRLVFTWRHDRSMGTQRQRSVITLIFFCYAASRFDFSSSSSTGQVGSYGDSDEGVSPNGIQSLCTSEQFIMQSYFSTHSSLDDSEFRDFLLKERSCEIPLKDPTFAPAISSLRRNIAGEGSHRHLLTSLSVLLPPQFHELVIIERLPLGVFADPFELQSLQQRRSFSEVAVLGDTNLELPSFRSNRSVVEIHVELDQKDGGNAEIGLTLPLHARYQPLEESGYSRVEFGEPNVLVCRGQDQTRCLVLSVGRSEIRTLVWEIPAGIRYHTEIVSVVTFAAAVLSAIAIVMASAFSSKVTTL